MGGQAVGAGSAAHPVDQIVDTAPALPILDVPVPLMGEQAGGSSVSSIRCVLLPSRLSTCPRSSSRTSPCDACVASRSWWNSWWKCQLSCTFFSRKLTSQFLVVEGDTQIFKFFSVDRVRRSLLRNAFLSGLWEQIVDTPGGVFKVYAQDSIQQRLRHPGFSRSPTDWPNTEDESFQGGFRTLPRPKKSARVTGHSSGESAPAVTLSGHQLFGCAWEPDERLSWYDEELKQARCRFEDSSGRAFWHLFTNH